MPIDADNSRATEAIRKRAAALGSSGGGVATEAELLAAVVDGALCFEEIDEEALLRCVEAFGPDTVIDAFLEADKGLPAAEDRLPTVDAGRKPVLLFLKKAASPGEFWSYRPYWIAAAAAAVALGFVVLWPAGTARPPISEVADNRLLSRQPPAGGNGAVDAKRAADKTSDAAASRDIESKSPGDDGARPDEGAVVSAAPARPALAGNSAPRAAEGTTRAETPAAASAVASSAPPASASEPFSAAKHFASHATESVLGTVAGSAAHAPAGNKPASTPAERQTTTSDNGEMLSVRANRSVAAARDGQRGTDIHYGAGRAVRVSVLRSDGSRLVASLGRPSFVQRPYYFHGHAFAVRSYYFHAREYNLFYRAFDYHGAELSVYAPKFYFSPGFYGWAYNPWAVPIAYDWAWTDASWLQRFGQYFQPSPTYSSAIFWLTDDLLARDLEAAYAAGEEASDTASARAALTPEVKQLLAAEVGYQIALENAERAQIAANQEVDPGSSGIPRILAEVAAGHPHVFVVGGDLDAVDSASGQECRVSDGDVLQLLTAPKPSVAEAYPVVRASKGGDCAAGASIPVKLSNLQEMQNHLRENIDRGLRELWAKQGRRGLPMAPRSAQAEPVEAQYVVIAPPPAPSDAQEIQLALSKAAAEKAH